VYSGSEGVVGSMLGALSLGTVTGCAAAMVAEFSDRGSIQMNRLAY
jgi:hypothetical protein